MSLLAIDCFVCWTIYTPERYSYACKRCNYGQETSDSRMHRWYPQWYAFDLDYRTYKLLRELLSVGKVTFLPQQTDMSWLYRGFDVVIVPSLEEPLGRIPLEAASYGVPAIVSDIDGLSETVIPGITGWRVRPGDPFALAHAIIEACEYSLDHIRQAVCEYAHYHYSGPYYTVKLMRFYAYVLETHKRHGA
jgi:glycosyltransferase involved in cell wall biosynthesis